MFTSSGLPFYSAPSGVSQSVPLQNKHSSDITKSSATSLQNAPITNYAEDLQTRLEVVSKLRVPQNEVQRAYGEFVKKLNDICYETVAEQLVRSRPASVAGSVNSLNTRPASRIARNPDNGPNSTLNRLYKAAEGVQKHLSTISESSHSEGIPVKQTNGRSKSEITVDRAKCLPNEDNSMDDTMVHFRSSSVFSKPSRKIAPPKKSRRKAGQSSAEIVETEFNITKDSLRNGHIVNERKEKSTIGSKTTKNRQNDDSKSVTSKTKKSRNEIAQDTLHEIRSKHKKTALSPFYQRQQKQRRLSPKMTPLFEI